MPEQQNRPQLRSSSASGMSSCSLSGGVAGGPGAAATGPSAGDDAAEGGAELPAAEDGLDEDAAVLEAEDPTDNPHLFKTATRSKSSADRLPAFLINLCFLRRSLRAKLRASRACFIACAMAAFACAMLSSKSMRGRFVRCFAAGTGPASDTGVAAGVATASSLAGSTSRAASLAMMADHYNLVLPESQSTKRERA